MSERTHRCLHCGLVLDRDENAARNILARALDWLKGCTVGHTETGTPVRVRNASGQKTTTALSAMGKRQARWMKEEPPRL